LRTWRYHFVTRSRLPIGQTLTAATNQKPGGAGAIGLVTCSVIAPAPPPGPLSVRGLLPWRCGKRLYPRLRDSRFVLYVAAQPRLACSCAVAGNFFLCLLSKS